MRFLRLALIGLVAVSSSLSMSVSATAHSASSAASSGSVNMNVQLDRFFSSDGPESLHEAKNAGTNDEPKAWPEANAWLHAQLSDTERDFLLMSATATTQPPTTTTQAPVTTTQAPATTKAATTVNSSPCNPTPCLNGGTCVVGTTTPFYSCSCASGFIGGNCQYSLFGSANNRARAAGKSFTRPNTVTKVKPHQA